MRDEEHLTGADAEITAQDPVGSRQALLTSLADIARKQPLRGPPVGDPVTSACTSARGRPRALADGHEELRHEGSRGPRSLGTDPHDLQAEIFDAVHQVESVPAYHLRTIEIIGRCVSHDSAILCSGPTVRYQTTLVNVQGPYMDLYMADPVRFAPDLRKAELALATNGGPFVDTEIYDARERDRLPFFAEVARPQGVSSFLVAQVRFRRQVCCVLTLLRYGRCSSFNEEDCRRLRALLPSLGLAYAALKAGTEERRGHAAGDLTPRETEISGLVHRGLTTPQIASVLGTSANTVRKQLVHLYDKLDLASRAELAAWFERHRGDVVPAQAALQFFRIGGED